jgi:hypothetical protein
MQIARNDKFGSTGSYIGVENFVKVGPHRYSVRRTSRGVWEVCRETRLPGQTVLTASEPEVLLVTGSHAQAMAAFEAAHSNQSRNTYEDEDNEK